MLTFDRLDSLSVPGDTPLTRAFWAHGRSADCPIIDVHGHMGDFNGIYLPRAAAPDMLHTMDECNVRLLVFSHHEALLSPDVGNSTAIEAVRRYPQRLRAYCVINPGYPDLVVRDLAALEAQRDVFVGLKYHPTLHGRSLSDPGYEPAWRYAEAHDLPILTHTWEKNDLCGPEAIRKVAERYPDVKLLLGHSCHADWDAAVQLARDFPNLYLELTAVFDDGGVLEKLVGEVGSQRLLFGVDLPWFDPQHGLGALCSAHISDEDRHNICHRNAAALLAPLVPDLALW
ncbi:MAG: amidohydrolase family protein [Anaerolineae bacterium]